MNGRTNTTSVTEVIEGVQVPLEAPTNLSIAQKDSELWLSWTDPVDKVASPGGEMVAEWNYTLVVRRDGRAPVSPSDGVQVLREGTRNQYSSTSSPFVDTDLQNGVTYYYAVYAYSTIGVVSEAATGSASPRNAKVAYYQTANIYTGESEAGVASTESHVLVAGGRHQYDAPDGSNSVNAINKSFTSTSAPALSTSVYGSSGGTLNGYGFIIGGSTRYGFYSKSSTIDIYSPQLTKMSSLYGSRTAGAISVTLDNLLVIAGGEDGNGEPSTDVTAISDSLTITKTASMSYGKVGHAGASNGSRAIFAGGGVYGGDMDNPSSVYAYDSSLTMTTASGLSGSYYLELGGAYLNNRALFVGGAYTSSNSYASNAAQTYDSSLTKQNISALSQARGYIGSAHVGGFAIFAGGNGPNGASRTAVDTYDSSFTRGAAQALPNRYVPFYNHTGVVDNVAMFVSTSGGSWSGIASYIVE